MEGLYFYLNNLSKSHSPLNLKYHHWQVLFVFSLGLFLGTAFCMKWMEDDLRVNNEKFTIIGVELFYSREKVTQILTSLDDRARTILKYHLFFDFAFMVGAFPGIASLCMMAAKKVTSFRIKKVLYVFAAFQCLAWLADIAENLWLLSWIKVPAIGNEFTFYHMAVVGKWIVALSAVTTAIFVLLRNKQRN